MLALALGGMTNGVRPIDMAQAYGVLANQGVRSKPMAITKVVAADGTTMYEFSPEQEVVLADTTSYIVTDMLRGVIERGTGRRANIGRPAAGKTGTTDSNHDAWFVGYTPDLVAAVGSATISRHRWSSTARPSAAAKPPKFGATSCVKPSLTRRLRIFASPRPD